MSKWKIPAWAKDITALGPFSTVVVVNGNLFFSGIVPKIKDFKVESPGNIILQTEEIFAKFIGLLQKGGLSLKDVFYVVVVIKATEDEYDNLYLTFNDIYRSIMVKAGVEDFPARTAIGVSALPFKSLIEIKFQVAIPEEGEEKPATDLSAKNWIDILEQAATLPEALKLGFTKMPISTGLVGPKNMLSFARNEVPLDNPGGGAAIKVLDAKADEACVLGIATWDNEKQEYILGGASDVFKDLDNSW